MDLNAIAALLIGNLIRFGLPILITALVVWTLKRLDARWQAEIEERRTRSLEGVAVQKIQCWDTQNCPEVQREECVAYQNPAIPCWQHFRNGRGELREDCLECEIFRITPITIAA
jgi:hypothetical protein